MKRIAIVTITNGGSNFGNRLQNYALQTVLERLGHKPETIFTANIIRRSLLLSRLRWAVRSVIKRTKRQYYFDSFNKRYIRPARRIRYQTLNDGDFSTDGYDAAITGSDQVWNPEFLFNTDFEFLPFVPPEKRYSYAASFGLDELTSDQQEAITRRLREMRKISVREDLGRVIVKDIIGADVPVHIDPALLLTPADYRLIEERPPQPLPEKYLLAYFLGEVPEAYREFVGKIASDNGLAVTAVNELPDSAFFNIGPQHFLYLIHHADFVCTDSYHGTLFSILFHRPFACFYRQGENDRMSSRLDTLLRITQLGNRLFGGFPPDSFGMQCDYSLTDRLLEAERARAVEYLTNISGQC